jgi:hypothetical protein
MNLNLKKYIKSKINSSKQKKYKYDDLINEQLNNIEKSKNEINNNYQLGNITVNRKIPNNEELKKMYSDFISNKQVNLKNKKFELTKSIQQLILKNENQYILIHLDLKKETKYKMEIYFELQNDSNIKFVLSNNKHNKIYNLKKNIKGKIHFHSNDSNLVHFNQLYILFNKQNNIIINNFTFNIQEINNNNDYNISLIKYTNKVVIF